MSSVSPWTIYLLTLALIIQITWRAAEPEPTALAAQLTAPPSETALRVSAFGEPIGLAQLVTLYIQAFDTQPGISLPFKNLNYFTMVSWLDRILDLDPASGYPLLLASQVYSQVPDAEKQRTMLEFVHQNFLEDPENRWRWLAHASIVAKHRLNDKQLALRYARAIANADSSAIPSWAKQMHIFLLEEMGEHETAKILLGGLLASGSVTDPHETHFLLERLQALENDENSSMPSNP